jgi:hypothetical protein
VTYERDEARWDASGEVAEGDETNPEVERLAQEIGWFRVFSMKRT